MAPPSAGSAEMGDDDNMKVSIVATIAAEQSTVTYSTQECCVALVCRHDWMNSDAQD